MRAGSLSEARVVALLSRHFVCARVALLCTKEQIVDPRDVALLEALDQEQASLPAHRRSSFFGGEREAFLTPEGELLEVFLSLHEGQQGMQGGQFLARDRAAPEAAVQAFFRRARRALEKVSGEAPEDLPALLTGEDPAVAAAAAAAIPAPAPEGALHLRVHVRNGMLMYDGLVGTEDLVLAADEARALLPERLEAGARCSWPTELFLRLAHRTCPRGHVRLALEDASVTGSLESQVLSLSGDLVHGRFTGAIRLAPTGREELGPRVPARKSFVATSQLLGDFVFDRRAERFTAFRMASVGSALAHESRMRYPVEDHVVGVELLRPQETRRGALR